MKILRELLDVTPDLRLCVLHGLNDLEWADAEEWCHTVLDMLFAYQQGATSSFHILLTTSGQSSLLMGRVRFEDQCFAPQPARKIQRLGRGMNVALTFDPGATDVA